MTRDLKEEYDEHSTTPSDYSLYFYIEPSITIYFDEQVYKQHSATSRGQQFKNMIKEKLDQLFSAPVGMQAAESKKLNIARIDLVFDNEYTIKMLRERGNALYSWPLL